MVGGEEGLLHPGLEAPPPPSPHVVSMADPIDVAPNESYQESLSSLSSRVFAALQYAP